MHVLVDAILYGLIIRVVLAFKIQLVISITISTAPINNRQHNRDRVLSPPQGCPGPGILRTHVMILHHRTDPYHTRCLQNIRHDPTLGARLGHVVDGTHRTPTATPTTRSLATSKVRVVDCGNYSTTTCHTHQQRRRGQQRTPVLRRAFVVGDDGRRHFQQILCTVAVKGEADGLSCKGDVIEDVII